MWGPIIGLLGMSAFQSRVVARRRVAERWRERTRHELKSYQLAASVSAATRRTPGHDFKKVLAALGYFGSDSARLAAAEQMSWPSRQTPSDGAMLAELVAGRPIRPLSAGGVWLVGPQVRRVADFLSRVDHVDSAVPVVVEKQVAVLRISVGDARLEVQPESWRVAFLLDTLGLGVTTFSIFRLSMLTVFPAAPFATMAARVGDAVALQLRSRGVFGRRSPQAMITLMLAGAAFEAWRSANYQRKWFGKRSTGGTQPFLTFVPVTFALIGQWPQLGRFRYAATTTLVGLMTGTIVRSGVPWHFAIRATASMLPTMAPAYSLRSMLSEDAAALELQLGEELNRAVARAHRQAAEDELERYKVQLDLAVAELERLGDRVPPAVAAELSSECRWMAEWLASPSALSALLNISPDEDEGFAIRSM